VQLLKKRVGIDSSICSLAANGKPITPVRVAISLILSQIYVEITNTLQHALSLTLDGVRAYYTRLEAISLAATTAWL